MKRFQHLCAVLAITLMGLTIGTSPAAACGGFFCNNLEPTVQTGERILFSVDGENIRAYVQVYYQGPAEDFAWIVPVASVPDVGVGTDEVFTQLDDLTDPRFQLDYNIDALCDIWPEYDESEEWSEGGGDGGEEGGEGVEDPYVNVLAEGEAGPYNYTVVESNNSDVLVAWLNENDYEQPPEALPLIEHYVAKEMKFVAVKLQPGKASGDIAPIVMDFQEQSPCIPLVLTSVAAQENMPVKAYVLGETRSVPTNWLHVTVNEKKLDWFELEAYWAGIDTLENSYQTTLIEAIQEADGHAFTTEYAGTSTIMNNQLDNGQYEGVEALLEIESPGDLVLEIQDYFSASNQLLNILQKHIPVPDGIEAMAFYNWPWDYEAEYAELDIDIQALYDELIAVIVTPVKEAQEMFDAQPYLTRLYSRVSIAAMDRDPIFEFQDAGDVSNVHKATFHMTCEDGGYSHYIELENGETFVPDNLPNWWNLPEGPGKEFEEGGEGEEEENAADLIELFTPNEGPKEVDQEHVEYVDSQLDLKPAGDVDVPATTSDSVVANTPEASDSSDGCSTHRASESLFGIAFFLMGWIILRRKFITPSC